MDEKLVLPARDGIGSRGEFIFCARIMNFCGRILPYFRPRFFGEKAETFDYLVELLDTIPLIQDSLRRSDGQ